MKQDFKDSRRHTLMIEKIHEYLNANFIIQTNECETNSNLKNYSVILF